MSLNNIQTIENNNYQFIFYQYSVPEIEARKWDKINKRWTKPLVGPFMEYIEERRNPACYGYKNGFIVFIKLRDQNKFMTINEFLENSNNKEFMDSLLQMSTNNDCFTYFEFQLPCFTYKSELRNYLLDKNDVVYLYFSPLPIQKMIANCEVPYKPVDVNDKETGGLWKMFKDNIKPELLHHIPDETSGYIYKVSKAKNGNHLLYFDPFFENDNVTPLWPKYVDENNVRLEGVENDYCNISTLLRSPNIDRLIKINYLSQIFKILQDTSYDRYQFEGKGLDSIFGYFRGNRVPWTHWKKSNYDDYFKFYTMEPREFYEMVIEQITGHSSITVTGGKRKTRKLKKKRLSKRKKLKGLNKTKKRYYKGGEKMYSDFEKAYDKELSQLTYEIESVVKQIFKNNSSTISSKICYLAEDGLLNKYEIRNLGLSEKETEIMNVCKKHFNQYNEKDDKVYELLKSVDQNIDELLAARIIQQKKFLLTNKTYEAMFSKYLKINADSLSKLISI
jgi:hypothetical protein